MAALPAPSLALALAIEAIIAIAARGCAAKPNCGAELHGALGSKGRPRRCFGCPLDDVDALWDAIKGEAA
jgi:hypothetical protein